MTRTIWFFYIFGLEELLFPISRVMKIISLQPHPKHSLAVFVAPMKSMATEPVQT